MLLYLWAQSLPTNPSCPGICVGVKPAPKGSGQDLERLILGHFHCWCFLGHGTFGISALSVPAVSNPSSFPHPLTPLKTQILSCLLQMDSPKRFGRCLLDSPPR